MNTWRFGLVMLGTAVLAGACSWTSHGSSGPCGAASLEPGVQQIPLASNGVERPFRLAVPRRDRQRDPMPLVVDLHGYSIRAADEAAGTQFEKLGDEEGFLVATPQALGAIPLWNATEVAGLPDDVGFLGALIDRVESLTCVDKRRVALTGVSNGAFMASTAGCRLAERITVVAPVAGLIHPTDCDPQRTVSVLGIHGAADRLVSLDGGLGPARSDLAPSPGAEQVWDSLPKQSVPAAAAAWSVTARCGALPNVTNPRRNVERIIWSDCAEGSSVRLDVIENVGHGWPGSPTLLGVGASRDDPVMAESATEEIWRFVRDHPRPV